MCVCREREREKEKKREYQIVNINYCNGIDGNSHRCSKSSSNCNNSRNKNEEKYIGR